jgi:phage N-6-adenine-methyltransferase
MGTDAMGRAASNRFNNGVRYRDAADPANAQFTPTYVLAPIAQALGGIGLDPCTTADNPTGAVRFYTAADDGLASPWSGPGWLPSVFVNPPYARAREPWVIRCMSAGMAGQRVVLLMPSHTDTQVFHKAISTADAMVFIRGRIKFGVWRPKDTCGALHQVAASHPSVLIGWNVDLVPCRALGTVLSLSREHAEVLF